MQDILNYVIKNIVTTPDDVKIEEVADETGTITYQVSVNPDDVGRLIGKEGKVIKAIRTIVRVIAIQKGVHVRVSVVSDSETSQAPNEPNNQAIPANETPVDDSKIEDGDGLSVEV